MKTIKGVSGLMAALLVFVLSSCAPTYVRSGGYGARPGYGNQRPYGRGYDRDHDHDRYNQRNGGGYYGNGRDYDRH